MRIAFFGTPAFAATLMSRLIEEKFELVAIVTQPDKPKGRSGTPLPSAVKEFAPLNIPLFQPAKASDPAFLEALKKTAPDILVVVAYGHILRQPLLDLAPFGAINVHASLLPRLRGAAPIQWSLIHGDKESGVTIMKLSLGMDEGDILLQKSGSINPDWDAEDLSKELVTLAAPALVTVLRQYESGKPPQSLPQDGGLATYAPKLEATDSFIDFKAPAEIVYNRIRGCNPNPGSWCTVKVRGEPKKLKILKARLGSKEGTSGQILEWNRSGLAIGCEKGSISLLKIQLEGKKVVDYQDFISGYPLADVSFS